MKRYLIVFGAVAVAACALARDMTMRKPIDPKERAARRARIAAMEAEESGGRLLRPHTLAGSVVCVDAQKKIPKAWIDEVLLYFNEETGYRFDYKIGSFDFASPKIEGNVTLFLVDDEKLPAILLAPENRWAVMNAATLAKETRPAYYRARSKKQLSRTLALLCGASNSQFPGALTRGIVDEKDLDKNIDYVLPVDVFKRFRTYLEPMGVKPAIYDTYDRACQDGWAPQPTNAVQKAIWDEIHAAPTAPIVIKPEPAKKK